jgi:hypothetical protein
MTPRNRMDRERITVTAYDLAEWHEQYVMVGGAAAALAGLIFVAVSLNHEHILRTPVLPSLAAQTLGLLIGLVLLSVVILTPGQSHVLVGSEITGLGISAFAFVTIANIRTGVHDTRRWWTISRLLLGTVATLPTIAGGITFLGKTGGGLYWLSVEVIVAILVAMYYAWILLIEIRR